MGQLFSDNFNRADSGNLGPNWTNNFHQGFGIIGNQAFSSVGSISDQDDVATYTGVLPPANQYAEAIVNFIPLSLDGGICCRQDPFVGEIFYLLGLNPSDAAVSLGQVMAVRLNSTVNSSFTNLAEANFLINTGTNLRVWASGTTIKGFFSGSNVASLTANDAAIPTGYGGFFSFGSGFKFDNFAVGDLLSSSRRIMIIT